MIVIPWLGSLEVLQDLGSLMDKSAEGAFVVYIPWVLSDVLV